MTAFALFEPFGGASGDMILGALVDAGLPLEALREGLTSLAVEGWSLSARRVDRRGIAATQVTVECEPSQDHRHLADLREILERSSLSASVKLRARDIFEGLARAEARVHGVDVEAIHFHEVGAVDAIVDVVGAVLGLELLGVQEVYVGEFPSGKGEVLCEHGRMPNPAPATAELLRGWPQRRVDLEAELVTPTGAAILCGLAKDGVAPPAGFCVDRLGYGAGSRDLPIPNVLRVSLGTRGQAQERVDVLEAAIDDMPAEQLAFAAERLLAAGALDTVFIPVSMKKGRPGTMLSVLCRPQDAERLALLVLRETSTLGVRRLHADRFVLPRSVETVQTPLGPVRVKRAVHPDTGERYAPEFEDARRLAQEHGLPLAEVYRIVTVAIGNISATKF